MKRMSKEEWVDAVATFLDDRVAEILGHLRPGGETEPLAEGERQSACMGALLHAACAWGRRVGVTRDEAEAAWRRARAASPLWEPAPPPPPGAA